MSSTGWGCVGGMFMSLMAVAADQPFKVSAGLDDSSATNTILAVSVSMAPHYLIYADQFHVEVPPPVRLVPVDMPAPEAKRDVFSGQISKVFSRDFHVAYRVVNAGNVPLPVTIRYQGCSQDQFGVIGLPMYVILMPRRLICPRTSTANGATP